MRPGGYVGLNEGFWYKRPAPEIETLVSDAIGPAIPTLDEWESIWQASALQDRIVRAQRVDARAEVRSRIQWIGWPWLVQAWGRALRLVLTNPAQRAVIKRQFDVPPAIFADVGYVLLTGRK